MKILVADILKSPAQTLINTVNCVGIMGKGIALEFKEHFPEMFDDYVKRCERKEVRPGIPYWYKRLLPPQIKFPNEGPLEISFSPAPRTHLSSLRWQLSKLVRCVKLSRRL